MADSSNNSSLVARPSGSGSTIDSFIGSLISLTSNSEIRYEGVLYTADASNARIALQNVRSFGTEGRKKDGPQIPPSEKVYEYIIFRATDIKELFVKSSPQAQNASQIHSDPAIISLQSQRSESPATSNAFGSVISGPLPDPNALGGSCSVSSTYQSSPLFHSVRNLGAWNSTPLSGNTGGSPAMPMYWQGYYGPTSGLMPHIQQPPLHFHTPPGMPMPPPLQQNMPPSTLVPSTPAGMSASSESNMLQSSSVQQHSMETQPRQSLVPGPTSSTAVGESTCPGVGSMSSSSSEVISGTTLNTPLTSSGPGLNQTTASIKSSHVTVPSLNKAASATVSTSSVQTMAEHIAVSTPLSVSTSGQPTLVTPGQLMQTGGLSTLKSNSLAEDYEEAESVRVSTQTGNQATSISQSQRVSSQPLLPLPDSSQHKTSHQINGTTGHYRSHYRRRGRGMGRGGRYVTTRFTEDFDFIAMNEKFKKDEVWGHLGKSEMTDRDEDGEGSTIQRNGDNIVPSKPVYVKDEFFDTLSCDALNGSRNDRKFSEQRRIDTETFGTLTRSRPGRGGRGTGYRGNFRGSYHGGQRNGYSGRGRGGGRTYY